MFYSTRFFSGERNFPDRQYPQNKFRFTVPGHFLYIHLRRSLFCFVLLLLLLLLLFFFNVKLTVVLNLKIFTSLLLFKMRSCMKSIDQMDTIWGWGG